MNKHTHALLHTYFAAYFSISLSLRQVRISMTTAEN